MTATQKQVAVFLLDQTRNTDYFCLFSELNYIMVSSNPPLIPEHISQRSFFRFFNKPVYLPLAIFILNFFLKIWYLDHRDLAMDEPFTVFYSQANLHDLFIMLKSENNPPLFFILLHFWIKLFGISVASVRFLPVIFSSLTAVFIYYTGKKYISGLVGLVASLLYTFSTYNMVFAHEARVYSLFAMLSTLSMLVFFSIHSKRSIRRIIMLAVVNALLVYSHFFGFFLILTQIIITGFITNFRKSMGFKFLLSVAGTFLLYLPYLPLLFFRYTQTIAQGTWVEKPIISDLYTMAWRFSNTPVATVLLLSLIITGTGFYLYRRFRHQIPSIPYVTAIMIWFFIPYFLMFLISFKQPIFLDRYTVFISVGYYLFIAVSIDLLSKSKWLSILLSLLTIGIMLITFTPDVDNKRRFNEAVQLVKSLKTPGTVVIICPPWLEYGFSYHYNLTIFKDYTHLRTRLNADHIYPVNSLEQLNSFNLDVITRIVYFEEWATLVDKEGKILKMLDGRYSKVKESLIYEKFTVHLYINNSPGKSL